MFDDELMWEEEEIELVDKLGMTPKQATLIEIEAIAKKYGFTAEDILGKKRYKMLVKVRRKCVVMLREKGYSTTEIGRIMQRDHSTIVHSLQMSKAEA